MSDLNLFINQDAINRSVSLVNKTGSGALPLIQGVNLVFADIYSTTLQFVNTNGTTGSYFNLSGSTATLALGNPGSPALAIASCSLASSSSYSCSFHLNTNELSNSLGSGRSRQYVLELQVISGSSVLSWQNPCVVYRDIVVNAIYPLNINYIISASYADTAKQVAYGDYNQEDPPISSFILARAEGGCLISMGEQNYVNQIYSVGMSVYDESIASAPDREIIRISPSVTWFSGSNNFGIGVSSPDSDPNNKLQVAGNISCYNITASNLLGTASWARNVITLDNNLTIDNSGLTVGSGDELVNIDTNKVDVAGVIRLSNAGLTAGFSSPDITTISNGKVTALHITASTITGSIHATSNTAGTVALTSGMALVSTNAVNTNSKIFLTSQTGDAGNLWIGSRSNGVSFQITSSTSNTETIAWFIIN